MSIDAETGLDVPSPASCAALLQADLDKSFLPSSDQTFSNLVSDILSRKSEYGITRLGSITRLDRIGIPVAQAVRPLSLSNAVSQGKGRTPAQAAVSALMESLETWAGERISAGRKWHAAPQEIGSEISTLYGIESLQQLKLEWLYGWDLLSRQVRPIPTALVDTAYVMPSPHHPSFPRTSAGLGAGTSLGMAVLHGSLELIEHDAVCRARQTIGFFDNWQMSTDALPSEADLIVKGMKQKGFVVGIWQLPTPGKVPAFWCHLVPPNTADEIAPLPSVGFASDPSPETALTKALVESAQARLSAISGAREDINRTIYESSKNRKILDDWRERVSAPSRPKLFSQIQGIDSSCLHSALSVIIESITLAGARAIMFVPLLVDFERHLHVVRMVAPALAHMVSAHGKG
jgi:ribosomal protein S12 methylthiotransferase accessory factor